MTVVPAAPRMPSGAEPGGPGVVDALALLPQYADEVVLGTVRDTHRAVARRVFRAAEAGAGGGAALPRVLHDGIATAVYAGIGTGLRATGAGLRLLGSRGVGPRLEDTPRGRFVQSAVHGIVGDRLHEEHPHLAISMSVRVAGRDVPVERERLTEAFPAARDRVVVFLHGLCENESAWEAHRQRHGSTYASVLEAQGWTPVLLRMNSGLGIAENAVALTSLLQRLVEEWPGEVRRLALVGHSMGGLVMVAACAVATEEERPWTVLLSDIVTLGTPHTGAPLARHALRGSTLLARLEESAAFGRILDHRSRGILGLELGLPDVEPLEGVRYRLVSASLGSERSPVGFVLGDLLVRRDSATGRCRRRPPVFPDAEVLHLHGTGHFGLLNSPVVSERLGQWLA